MIPQAYDKRIRNYLRTGFRRLWILRGFAVFMVCISIAQLMVAAKLASYVELSLPQLFQVWVDGFSPADSYPGVLIRAVGEMLSAMMTAGIAAFTFAASFHVRFLTVIAEDYIRLRDEPEE